MSSKKEKKAENSEDEKLRARVEFVNGLSETEAYHDSPINLDICMSTPIILPKLAWFNYEFPPKKMKITNSGHTVILSAKWYEERPFLSHGPTQSTYVFNQMHFHWGSNDCDGSEHTVENKTYPLEMHVVHFKSSYATQDIALREKDGMVVLIYFFQLQDNNNSAMDALIQGLPYIAAPHTSVQISPFSITDMIPTFADDYLVYWGCVNAVTCKHRVMWIISREQMGISSSQLEKFRMLMSTAGEPLPKHSRKVNASPRTVFHVNGGATPISNTLLPVRIGRRSHISRPGPGYKKATAQKKSSIPLAHDPLFSQTHSQSIPVFAMENNHFKMPFKTETQLVHSCEVDEKTARIPSTKSVTFSSKQEEAMRLEEERIAEEEKLRLEHEIQVRQENEMRQKEAEEQNQQLQAQKDRERREAEEAYRRQQELQDQAERERQLEEERQRQEIQMWENQQVEVFNAATQKPSIGFKLRKPLVHMKRKLDMATQAPSYTAMYRPANALSTATVYPDDVRSETALEGNEPSFGPSEVASYAVNVAPSQAASYGVSEVSGTDDYSTLSCFDTKDYHLTPKGSIAPTASARKVEEEFEVYNTTSFKEVDPYGTDRKSQTKH